MSGRSGSVQPIYIVLLYNISIPFGKRSQPSLKELHVYIFRNLRNLCVTFAENYLSSTRELHGNKCVHSLGLLARVLDYSFIETDLLVLRTRYYLLRYLVPDTFLFLGVWGFRFGADDPGPVSLDR